MKNHVEARFELGSQVTWTSQAGGTAKSKTGVIEQVLMPGQRPDRTRFEQLYRGPGVGMPRGHVSYVVRVPGKTVKSAGNLYWPRAQALANI